MDTCIWTCDVTDLKKKKKCNDKTFYRLYESKAACVESLIPQWDNIYVTTRNKNTGTHKI
jgi:hypothetical protein